MFLLMCPLLGLVEALVEKSSKSRYGTVEVPTAVAEGFAVVQILTVDRVTGNMAECLVDFEHLRANLYASSVCRVSSRSCFRV